MGGPTTFTPGTGYRLGLGGQRGSVFGDQFELRLDPKIQADIAAIQFRLEFDRLRSYWINPDWSLIDTILLSPVLPVMTPATPMAPGPLKPGAAAGFCSYKPGKPPAEPKKATAGDVLKAVWAVPCVKHAVDNVSSEAKSQWNSLKTGQKAIVIGHTVVLGASLVAAIAQDDASRVWVLDKLDGVDIPIPKVDGLTFRIHTPNGVQKGGGLGYKHRAFEVSGDVEQKGLPHGQQYNAVNFSLKLNLLEIVPGLKSHF